MTRSMVRRILAFGILAGFVGCGAEGTTPDTKPTAPPVTAENSKSLADSINSQKGGMGPGGVAKTPKK